MTDVIRVVVEGSVMVFRFFLFVESILVCLYFCLYVFVIFGGFLKYWEGILV